VLKAAIAKYLAHRKEKKNAKVRAGPVVPHGRQTVKQLVGQNAGVSNIEITDSNIRSFDCVARKYGVDYAVKKTAACRRQNISSFSRRGMRTRLPPRFLLRCRVFIRPTSAWALEKEKPNHFAVWQYKKYKLAVGKTAKSILPYLSLKWGKELWQRRILGVAGLPILPESLF